MFRSDAFGGAPGFSAAAESLENVFTWGKEGLQIWVGGQVDGTARDAGNTPTTVLRAGLLMGKIAATGNWIQYSATATDGSSTPLGILGASYRMQDLDANNQNKFVPILVGGLVQAAKIIGLDEAARAAMAARFFFDDRNFPLTGGAGLAVAKTANYTVVNGTDNGVNFTTTGNAAPITFPLPTTITPGQRWRFTNTVDQNMIVAAPAGKMVAFNNNAATSVAFSTSGNKIGGAFDITVDPVSLKYIAAPLGANTVTVA